ncbi:MAG: hypothetical protein CM15mP51_24850 [Porticoccaceae bacterium]|nr:MAG: hypothetical protein CM15mP51_24850 [Porticoccaceae bacterium]
MGTHICKKRKQRHSIQKIGRYYTGEWFENLYPGYSNYSEYRGSMHILYEQSGEMAEDGVRRPEGTVQILKKGPVHHQFVYDS